MLKLLMLLLLASSFNSLELVEEKKETFTLTPGISGKESKEFTILEIESDTPKRIIESLDNDYKVTMRCDDREECDWEYDGKKSILTYYSSKINNRYFEFDFELTKETKFTIYYYKPTTAGQVFLVILYILLNKIIRWKTRNWKKNRVICSISS